MHKKNSGLYLNICKFFSQNYKSCKVFYGKLNIKLINIAYCINNLFEMISDSLILYIIYCIQVLALFYDIMTLLFIHD
jgi:hypothetical protein